MKHKEKLFYAVDFTDLDDSKRFISEIEDYVGGLKIGLEFFSRRWWEKI